MSHASRCWHASSSSSSTFSRFHWPLRALCLYGEACSQMSSWKALVLHKIQKTQSISLKMGAWDKDFQILPFSKNITHPKRKNIPKNVPHPTWDVIGGQITHLHRVYSARMVNDAALQLLLLNKDVISLLKVIDSSTRDTFFCKITLHGVFQMPADPSKTLQDVSRCLYGAVKSWKVI